jgi:NAD(P)H-dependent FMN reductase
MKHYKDPITNELYAYAADGSQDAFIKEGLVAMTAEEVAAIHTAREAANAVPNRITELKRLLAESDFRVLPDYDKDSEEIKAQRQAWREEIRALEAQS